MTRKLRRDFEIDISKDLKDKPKVFWSYAKSRLKTREQISTLINPDGSPAATPQEKAETLNNFFASVFTVEDLDNVPPAPAFSADEVIFSILITTRDCAGQTLSS